MPKTTNKTEVYNKVLEIGQLFYLSSLELLGVVYDIKPAMAEANTGVYDVSTPARLKKLGELCSELGLKMAFSRRKYIINSPRGIFQEVSLDDPRDGNLIIGISKDRKKALSAVAHYHWKMLDSRYGKSFGKLMGYPDCCLEFGNYLNNNDANPDNFGFRNPAVESLKRSKKVAWQLNVFILSLIPHFPCSLDCSPSKKYVDAILDAMRDVAPDFVAETEDQLKNYAALYWNCADRILLKGDFQSDDFLHSEIAYKKMEPRITSAEFYQDNDSSYLAELRMVQKKIVEGNRLTMTPDFFEVYKDGKSLIKKKKDHPYIPILVKSSDLEKTQSIKRENGHK
ncbi:MAG: hypothetical protein M1586_01630 [Patescibacteria group bacterium]|nr:hypothetical protein [Patescibacteria group bacterium]MCL5261984.1 hypothetical protein [Patescibacteria group bacterium]